MEEIHHLDPLTMIRLLYEANLIAARPPLGKLPETQGPNAAEAQHAWKTSKKEWKDTLWKRSEAHTARAIETAAAKLAVVAVITHFADPKILTNSC
mmetsp:Transcript_7015/g.14608  ORF Transcript_7015/g.14608 Transcript_7015/m.14608 type:complete len:96 (-) Transcript_7015:102-389(-)